MLLCCLNCFRCFVSLIQTDIDECATAGTCDANAACTNTPPGTFTCACNSGYDGDGTTCTGNYTHDT